jgi:hypothetical protein
VSVRLLGLILACAATACGTASPATQLRQPESAPITGLADSRTFAFGLPSQPVPPFEPRARWSEVERRLRPLLAAELESKGYTETTQGDRANFVVVVASGSTQDGVSEGQAGGTRPVVKGRVVVDAFNASNDVRVWRQEVESDVDLQNTNDNLLRAVVRRMMVSFPDRHPRTSSAAP